MLLNNTGGGALSQISEGIDDILYGREPQPPKQSVARALLATIRERGVEAAVSQYHDLRANKAGEYDLGEGELSQLGRILLQEGRTDYAIAVFTLNVESFPKSSIAYDRLAEAYVAKGDKALAIKNYAHSIEINPANTDAVKKLKELSGKP